MDKDTLMQIGNCAICPNMCRFDCPVNNVLRREGVSPSGKMRLAYMLEKGMLEPSAAVVENLYQCLGCHGCETWCPFPNLSVADLLAESRISYAARNLAPAAAYDIKEQLNRTYTLYPSEAMGKVPVDSNADADVLLFAGCAYRRHRPQAITAAINVLKAAGLTVAIMEDETCCGFPAGCLGMMDTSGRLAMRTAGRLQASQARRLVTLCPECYSAFTQRYPAAGVNLDMQVTHFIPLVLELIEEGRLPALSPLEAKVVWHDPCILGRGLKIYEEPRQLLAAIPGLQLAEARYNREQAHCCGAGQLYDLRQPLAARQIAEIRVSELEELSADMAVTSCPFCEHQLEQAGKLPIVDISEVLWAALEVGRSQDFFLQTRINQKLASEPQLEGKRISVSVNNSLVKLEGQVDTWLQVVKAGQLAGTTPGVYSVVNEITCPGCSVPEIRPTCMSDQVMAPVDVVIIGAGVIGCALARELSRYDLKIVVLEKASDVSTGASKANNGMIHPGIFVEPGTLKARLNVRGVQLYQQLAEELDFPLRWCGLMGVVIKPDELFLLDIIKAQAEKNGVNDVELLTREQVFEREPNVTSRALGGFFAPTTGMVSPYKVTTAYAENAAQNGVEFFFDTPVIDIRVKQGEVAAVVTPKGVFPCKLVINAAGIYADQVAAMAGEPEFTLHPRRGELLIFDNKQSQLFDTCLAEVTLNIDPHTKGGGIMMTIDGNIEMGPTAEEVPEREDVATTTAGMERILSKFEHLLEGFDRRSVIAYFSGLRAATYTEDFHIRFSRRAKGLLNVAGIQSPGLAAAPAIAEYVIQLLNEYEGIKLVPNPKFNPRRKEMPHFKKLSTEEQNELIKQDPRYGRVVCRCETVTEGEIVEAVHRPIPAVNLDAVKRRTRAGMGRCQGGFCTSRVAEIIAREKGIPMHEVTKDGEGSWMFVPRRGGCRE